jgi:hypothetical protein
MKANLFMLSLFLVVQVGGSGLLGQNITGQVNDPAWNVPGIKPPVQGRMINQREDMAEGIKVQVSSLVPESNGNDSPGRTELYFTLGDNEERKYVVNAISRYAVNGKPFCYVLSVSPTTTNYIGEFKVEGVLGMAITYAYYDEEGQGKFKTRESINSVRTASYHWQVRIPDWVKKASQKQ